MREQSKAVDFLIRRLDSIGELGDADRRALEGLAFGTRRFGAEQDLLREGERAVNCCVLLSGWICRHKKFLEGDRQILSLHLPGDLIDFHGQHMPAMDHTITALTEVEVACIAHAAVRDLLAGSHDLAAPLWRGTLVEAAITRQWLLNIGQRSAQERLAHLICELLVRLRSIGLAQEIEGTPTFTWPMTQLRLGQALGLSAVHVNRSLQELRARKLIRVVSNRVTILDWPQLKEAAGFDPAYLGLEAGV